MGFPTTPRFRKRFQRESHAAAILQEPHVIPIHDWGEIDGRLYIDMRLVRGHTLDELIANGPLEPSRSVAIIRQVGAALDAAHAEGLLNRDVKPRNIIVTEADFAYLVDFGIAETRGDTRLTTAGTLVTRTAS
jgi:serine/threonine-protein kinase